MPDARDLRRLDSGGQTAIFAGSRQLFRYPEGDTALRNIAVAALRQLGFSGEAVAGSCANFVMLYGARQLLVGLRHRAGYLAHQLVASTGRSGRRSDNLMRETLSGGQCRLR